MHWLLPEVLHEIVFEHNVLSIRVTLQPCPILASFYVLVPPTIVEKFHHN